MRRDCVVLGLLLFASALSVPARSRGPVSPVNPGPSGRIRRHSKVYIAPMGGFEITFFAALDKQVVPLVIVETPNQAEFEIKETGQERVTWARMIFASQPLVRQQPEIVVTSLRSGQVVLACPVVPMNSPRIRDAIAQDCAKRLKGKLLEK